MRHLCFVVLIFTTTFVRIQSENSHGSERSNDYSKFEVSGCKKIQKEVRDTVGNSHCMPYDRHVPIRSMPGQTFHPSVVIVKRCDGHCTGLTCMPTKTKIKKVPVKIYDKAVNSKVDGMCAMVEVEEHLGCRCMCRQQKNECNERQMYVEHECACVCKDQEIKKSECEMQKGMFWNRDKCMCECTYMNMECTTGSKWSRKECGCVSR